MQHKMAKVGSSLKPVPEASKMTNNNVPDELAYMNHVCLSGKDLEEFRTKQCPLYVKGMCQDSVRCNMSHSETWPRRNPSLFKYDYKLCPNIQFFRMYNKMQLQGKCHYGRRCRYSHSKEEQLYHPELYKTRMCLNYPDCKGYFCPFAHSKSEIRERKEGGTKNKSTKVDKPKKAEQQISLTETYYAPDESVIDAFQSQMLTNAIQFLYNEDYKKDTNMDISSLNTTVGSPGTMSSNDVASIMDFDLNASLGETLRLHDEEENGIQLVNPYLTLDELNKREVGAKDNINVENNEDVIQKEVWSNVPSDGPEDDEEDGWLEVVLQTGLKLLIEDDDKQNKRDCSVESGNCNKCETTKELTNQENNLATNWWI
ncbi:hypothetical protein BBOV_III011400 [Babesia bovis T2Bo]|uniref:C3H1-type domain-containing protein n=1 Tax=Babesia bovis TaxID=5865 RepID=A7AQ58_BABBO|nr:hypothetical protein BBOV_III011400 [Babesia bovis T2Bo]EDO08692.1 hypothetical protein BBOV_III011400 [Babesia bovis T2Bo]|eukprot:XP_001612260.1 hypothetical protein [Babesia bovis T2Bo]